jgi:hypothetical protein
MNSKKANKSNYLRQLKGHKPSSGAVVENRRESIERARQRHEGDEIDSKFGFDRYKQVKL